jgi:signal transduction histidine kinase
VTRTRGASTWPEYRPPADGRGPATVRAVRAAVLTPVVVLGTAVLVSADVDAVTRGLGITALVVLLGLGAVAGTRPAAEPDPRVTLALTALGAAGVVAGVAVLTVALDGDPQRFTLVFGVVTVAAAFGLPPRQRWPLVVAAACGWGVALWLGGVRDEVALVTQFGGALLLALVALRTTSSLEAALAIERSAASASRVRASLSASVLRLQSLEPQAVAEALVAGVREAGLDDAVLRVVEGDGLRTIALRTAEGIVAPPTTIGVDEGLAGLVRRTGRVQAVADYGSFPDAVPGAGDLRGMVAAPVHVGGELTAVLIGARRGRPLTGLQRQAVELLAEEAGTALGRARRFAADAATVAELRRLEERTHDFVSTVSHELRTPMTVITGLGQTLARRWDDLGPERRADLLRRIDENADRLAVMLRSLVDSSALERGRLVANTRPVDLATTVDQVLGRLSPLLAEHPTTVLVPPDTWVAADPALIEHVIENLLANAARHTPAGTPVTIAATRHDDHPEHESEVEVEVLDAGPGIGADDLPHVLERFYRAGAPTTRRSGGLGLGLALSQQVMRAHGRDLTVSSTPGEGTRFVFRLPRASPPPAGR